MAEDRLWFEFSDDRMPRFGPAEWGLRPSRGTVVTGLAAAAAAVATIVLFSVQDLLVARAPSLPSGFGARREAQPPPARPADPAQVERAFTRVRDIYNTRGAPALATEGEACFAGLVREPSYPQLDFCLAFDAFAGGVAEAAGAGSASAADYFNEAAVRHIRAMDTVGLSQSAARARIRAISAMALAVGRTQPSIVPPPPLEEEIVDPLQENLPPPATEEAPYELLGPGAAQPAPTPLAEPAPPAPPAGAQPGPAPSTPAPQPAPAPTAPPAGPTG